MNSNFLKQSFTWFVDLSTSADSVQVVKVSAGGKPVQNRLLPFFSAFKYYKLGGVSVKFCPASTLPVDPTGLSYEAGENTVDPRDQFNPGLVRITNGEDMFEDANELSLDNGRKMYYAMMLDRRWYKFQLQSGFKRYVKPLFWSVAQLHQDMVPGAGVNTIDTSKGSGMNLNATNFVQQLRDNGASYDRTMGDSNARGLFQTGAKERMGWMPTDKYQVFTKSDGVTEYTVSGIADVPEVELLKIVLPMAYKTKYYYRVYITETVYFKDPVSVGYNGYQEMDRFITPTLSAARFNAIAKQETVWRPDNTGGNV